VPRAMIFSSNARSGAVLPDSLDEDEGEVFDGDVPEDMTTKPRRQMPAGLGVAIQRGRPLRAASGRRPGKQPGQPGSMMPLDEDPDET